MTDFSKWDKFDADAAEKGIERKARLEEEKRARAAEEQRAIKLCQDRAARLKSEAVVRALKAKRGSRRRPVATTTNTHNNASSDGKPGDDAASLIKASAEEAEAIAEGLRRGLELRDEVVAEAETGDLHRGVERKARECLAELEKSEKLLRKAAGLKAGCGDDGALAHGGSVSPPIGGSTCCSGGGSHSNHAHSHAHHGHTADNKRAGADCTADGGGGGTGHGAPAAVGQGERGDEGARAEMAEALGVLRRAKTACRVAEGACLMKAGRVAESTETLRESLFEDPKSVPAWVARGESFLAMKAPLLAGLHFDRALELDRGCAAAASHKERLQQLLSRDAEIPAGSAAPVTGADDGRVEHVRACVTPQRKSHTSGSTSGAASNADDDGTVNHSCTTPTRRPPQPNNNASTSAEGGAGGDPKETLGEATGRNQVQGKQASAAAAAAAMTTNFRQAAIAAACESYRAGVVLHQEAFLSSSREKFLRTLELLEEARAAAPAAATAAVAAGGCTGEEPAVEKGELSEKFVGEGDDGGDGSEGAGRESVERSAGADGLDLDGRAGGGVAVGVGAAAARVVEEMRMGCHLNIAAAFLLRKTDFPSAVDHCTRALVLQPGNTRALVRRAQAHQELGRFRLAVEDLEAAEALLLSSAGTRDFSPGGRRAEAHGEELEEVVKRLKHARWTKVVVGNGKDELPRA